MRMEMSEVIRTYVACPFRQISFAEPQLFWFVLRINHQHLLGSQFSEQGLGLRPCAELPLNWNLDPCLKMSEFLREAFAVH